MATIAQTAPFSDVVQASVSDTYVNQIVAAGALLPIVWTTLISTPAFVVSSNGNVGTSALQNPGSYTASGSMIDANNNTGIWTFTLTVTGAPVSPQTSVIPSDPGSPTGIELMTPFQINPVSGQVATVSDYETVIAQHVLSILMTAKNERVMLPTYGVGMETFVFSPGTGLEAAVIQSSIISAFKTWEPAATVQNVVVGTNPTAPNVLNVTVQYSTVPFTGIKTVTIALGGAVATAPITPIGTFTP